MTIPRLRVVKQDDETRTLMTVEPPSERSASGMRVRPTQRSAPHGLEAFRLSGPIGVGGTSTIHLGIRAEDPSRVYAIKKLHPQLAADGCFAQMLLDEAAIAARIRHDNVIHVHGACMVGGDLAVVMDFRAGVSLAELIAAVHPRTLPPRIATAIVASALRGLHAAHETVDETGRSLGIVHRDVSPQNIHIGVDGVARVLDFGIARATNRVQRTRAGEIKGKLAYMAPEQLLSGGVDRRVDIRAAAVVLWETLTCTPLFHGESEGETIARVLSGCSTRPSEIVPGVPPALDAVVMRGLSQRTEDRFATALEMADALDALFASHRAHANEIGAWVAAFASGSLREQWNVRSQLFDPQSTAWAAAAVTSLMPAAVRPAPAPASLAPSAPIATTRRPPPPSIAARPGSGMGQRFEMIAAALLVIVLMVLAVLTDRAMSADRSKRGPLTVAPAKAPAPAHANAR